MLVFQISWSVPENSRISCTLKGKKEASSEPGGSCLLGLSLEVLLGLGRPGSLGQERPLAHQLSDPESVGWGGAWLPMQLGAFPALPLGVQAVQMAAPSRCFPMVHAPAGKAGVAVGTGPFVSQAHNQASSWPPWRWLGLPPPCPRLLCCQAALPLASHFFGFWAPSVASVGREEAGP